MLIVEMKGDHLCERHNSRNEKIGSVQMKKKSTEKSMSKPIEPRKQFVLIFRRERTSGPLP